MSGYQRFLSTNDGDRNSHWENTQQSKEKILWINIENIAGITQDSYQNLIRKAIGRTKSQDPTQNKTSSEEKF